MEKIIGVSLGNAGPLPGYLKLGLFGKKVMPYFSNEHSIIFVIACIASLIAGIFLLRVICTREEEGIRIVFGIMALLVILFGYEGMPFIGVLIGTAADAVVYLICKFLSER